MKLIKIFHRLPMGCGFSGNVCTILVTTFNNFLFLSLQPFF